MSSDELHPAAEIFREWLNRGRAGCKFASHLASKARLAFYVGLRPISSENASTVTAHVDRAARDGLVAIILFPRARAEEDAATLVNLLAKSSRWQVETKPLPVDRGEREGIVGVTIGLRTTNGDVSFAMGFGPSYQLPTTRRGPYLGLAVWAGGRANPYFDRGRSGSVNLAHAPHDLPEDGHAGVWAESERGTAQLLAEPPDDARWLRDVAFCLPEAWLS